MRNAKVNYYATLGLDTDCSLEQIRAAYRVLAKQHHPDLNPASSEALSRTQEINAAHEILSDPERRSAYDEALRAEAKQKPAAGARARTQPIAQEMLLRLEEFFRGTSLEVRVNDPGSPGHPELYSLEIPPATAPGTRFRIRREGVLGGGHIDVRVKARPDFRFKLRGSDLRCDLRIKLDQAIHGGSAMLVGPTDNRLQVRIPRGISTGEVLRVEGEGLPKTRGGRGDLLVRIVYRPEVRISRKSR